MRVLFRFPVIALTVLWATPLAAATVASRDDARQCYLGTLSEPTATNYHQRLADCDRAIANENSDSDLRAGLLVNRSDLKLKAQDFQGAVTDATAAIALEPDLATAFLNQGAGLIGLKRYRDALDALERVIALNKGERLQIAYFNRGLARDYLGDLQAAYFDYKKATEIDPNFAPAKIQLERFTVTTRRQ